MTQTDDQDPLVLPWDPDAPVDVIPEEVTRLRDRDEFETERDWRLYRLVSGKSSPRLKRPHGGSSCRGPCWLPRPSGRKSHG